VEQAAAACLTARAGVFVRYNAYLVRFFAADGSWASMLSRAL